MQKNMSILSKGKYIIRQLVENYADSDDSNDFDKQSIVNCLISPNQQNLAIIYRKRKLYCFGSDQIYSITIINVISKETIFQSKIKCFENIHQIPCEFSIDSQYFIFLIEGKLIIINIFDKSEQRLNYQVFNIISIDFNYILKLQTLNKILHYSLTQKEIVKQVDWNWDIFFQFIDSVSNNIYLVRIINWNMGLSQTFQIIFQEKILKTIKSKYVFNYNDFKYFDQQQLVGCGDDMKDNLESVWLYDLKTSKILRTFKRKLQIQNQYKSRTITNIKQKQRCFYIFYIDENQQFIRFNLITGVRIKLDFRVKSLKDKVINSENVYVDITNEKKLRYFYFKQQ